jgi:hypothetical protein
MHPQGWSSGIVALVTLLSIILSACGRSDQDSDRATPGIEVRVAALTEQEAAQAVRTFASRPGATVTVRYPVIRQNRVSCSAAEIEQDRSARPNNPELWRCRTVSGGSTYYKTVSVSECCDSRQIRLPDGGDWKAVYVEAERSWQVELTFNYEGLTQNAKWTVDDETKAVNQH